MRVLGRPLGRPLGVLLGVPVALAMVALGTAWFLLRSEPGTAWLLARLPGVEVSPAPRGACWANASRRGTCASRGPVAPAGPTSTNSNGLARNGWRLARRGYLGRTLQADSLSARRILIVNAPSSAAGR